MKRIIRIAVLSAALPMIASDVGAERGGLRDCSSGSTIDATRLERLSALGAVYTEWTGRGCVPPAISDERLASVPHVDGAIIAVNGREALVRNPQAEWIGHCNSTLRTIREVLPTSGADLRTLTERIRTSTTLGGKDLIEVGFGHALTVEENPIYTIHLATRERAVRLECYSTVEGALDQAAAIFREDEEAVTEVYDFLRLERGSEPRSSEPGVAVSSSSRARGKR